MSNEHKEKPASSFAEAFSDQSPERRQKLLTASNELRVEMEALATQVHDLVIVQPPIQLLGYLWAQFHVGVLSELQEKGEAYRPNKQLIEEFQFALEYVHAVWSSHTTSAEETAALNEAKAGELLKVLEKLKSITMMYCMASSAASFDAASKSSHQSSDTEFHAKSSWVVMRGNRYQVLEEEFFKFILAPHADALYTAYGMKFEEIAAGIQELVNSMRTGVSEAVQKIDDGMQRVSALASEGGRNTEMVIKELHETDSAFTSEMSNAMRDILFGGTCNLSRHTRLSPSLLEDLSYAPGQNTEFFADGDFKGTPLRTLPARIRPGILLGGEYYATDGQFIRDAAYRAIQRGLLNRLPAYREEWNRRQKELIEQSYPLIFRQQFSQATKFTSVYFKDSQTALWAETDTVIILADVMLVIEAKAGVMAMHSPATNFDRHERVIQELIIKAYKQCGRFIEYLASASVVPIYNLVDGQYVEIAKLKHGDFRTILPIGLTVETFTPFSAMCKELSEIRPVLDKHPFISMSVDDLFVLNRFLPTAGEFLHYLEVRQQVAGIPKAMLYDEIEHLGAYIADNRFDMALREQLQEADFVTWDSFGDSVDKHFEGDAWKTDRPPHQEYPEELSKILDALDCLRPTGWLALDSHIRNFSSNGRMNLAEQIAGLKDSLMKFPVRRLLFGLESPVQIWVCRVGSEPTYEAIQFQGQVSSMIANTPRVLVLCISYNREYEIVGLRCAVINSPSVVQTNYGDILKEVEKQRGRIIEIDQREGKNKKKNKK